MVFDFINNQPGLPDLRLKRGPPFPLKVEITVIEQRDVVESTHNEVLRRAAPDGRAVV